LAARPPAAIRNLTAWELVADGSGHHTLRYSASAVSVLACATQASARSAADAVADLVRGVVISSASCQ